MNLHWQSWCHGAGSAPGHQLYQWSFTLALNCAMPFRHTIPRRLPAWATARRYQKGHCFGLCVSVCVCGCHWTQRKLLGLRPVYFYTGASHTGLWCNINFVKFTFWLIYRSVFELELNLNNWNLLYLAPITTSNFGNNVISANKCTWYSKIARLKFWVIFRSDFEIELNKTQVA